MVFADCDDAGRRLAARLGYLQGEPVVALGLPRGGVPVAFQVAQTLGTPLDVIVVRKLGVPFQPELGMGAVGGDGVRVLNPEVVHASGVSEDEVAAVQAREQAAVEARAARYRVRRPREPLNGRVAVVVDDGIPAPRAPPAALTRRPAARKWSPAPASSAWLATWPCRKAPGGSWFSSMAAAAAGTVLATGMSPAS